MHGSARSPSAAHRAGLNRALLVIVASTGLSLAVAALATPAHASTRAWSIGRRANPAAGLPGGVAVGLPTYGGSDDDRGLVDAFGSSGIRQSLDRSDSGSLPEESFSAFGTSIALGDLDGDGDQDLVVGAPGSGSASAGRGSPGEVDVFFRRPAGFRSAAAVRLMPSSSAGDRVGAAVVLTRRQGDDGRVADLWVGAPGTDVDGVADAGTVYHYTIATHGDGRRRPAITLAHIITQDTTAVGGVVEAGDRFGSVLAPATGGVVVGVPDEDIRTADGVASDAGAIQRIRVDAGTGELLTGQNFSQATPGVPGRAEPGDRFGAAVGAEGYAVGVPGEDVGDGTKAGTTKPGTTKAGTTKPGTTKAGTTKTGTTKPGTTNAGMVQTFRSSTAVRHGLTPTAGFTQDSEGVRGTVETGDQFGASVAVGIFDCRQVLSVAAGVPGEDLGSTVNAGTVEVFRLPWSRSPCASRGLHQGHGLPGMAEADDRTGASLTTVNGDPESEQDRHDTLVIGIPGEDVRAAIDTGRAITWRQRVDTVFGHPGDPSGLDYGSVLSTEPS